MIATLEGECLGSSPLFLEVLCCTLHREGAEITVHMQFRFLPLGGAGPALCSRMAERT